ncbi:TlyA family RNA methyltransferase [Pseudothauera rhizosphaerae]|uniref:TlyA family RNA methyltransferase n=1 Tax=Pseudothauera rhizosphaerae TaxID=2565932 RepID=A0A4S4AY43_9RHOO|nr:TlyA family RNA methyltransferase [Pseudothauera rhizosphaerae]THF65056.1 TlyA family RNA methyltransferase [Pseudothauera rhizosphaerae]
MKSFHRRSSRPATERPLAAAPVHRDLPRADQLLVQQGLAPSRTAARALIEAGRVSADGAPVTKPAQELPESAVLAVAADEADRFVSRGGRKLAGALAASGLEPTGRTCLDVGQSTGGFTDCLLQAGAARVVGVEVGHGQIHPRLADDPRCVTLEGINARHLSAVALGGHFPPGGFGLIVCDASFISLALLFPQWPALLATGGDILALVKPQFEVGPQGLGKGGIVRDAALYREVEDKLRAAAAAAGLAVCGWYDSPIAGGDGNREFFLWMRHAQD